MRRTAGAPIENADPTNRLGQKQHEMSILTPNAGLQPQPSDVYIVSNGAYLFRPQEEGR